MVMLPETFNPTEVEPAGGGQGMPLSDANGHLVRIVDSKWVPFKNNPNGGRLLFELEIIEGQHMSHKGSYGLNLGHETPKVVEIAKGELSAMCHVIGIFNAVSDTQVLHGKPFRVCVRTQSDQPQYTEIWKVLDAQGRSAKEIRGAGPQAPAGPAMTPAPVAAAPAPMMAAPAPAMAPAPVMAAPAPALAMAPPMAPPVAAAPPAAPAMAPVPVATAPVAVAPPAAPALAVVAAPVPAPAMAPPVAPVAAAPAMAPPVAAPMAPPPVMAPPAGPPAVGGAPWEQ